MEEKQQKSGVERLSEMLDEMLLRNGLEPIKTVTKTGSFIYIPRKNQTSPQNDGTAQ